MVRHANRIVTASAIVAFGLAMLLWGLVPSSDCSTPPQIHWLAGMISFSIFAVTGIYISARGTRAQCVLLLASVVLIVPIYMWVLSLSLPMVIGATGCPTLPSANL